LSALGGLLLLLPYPALATWNNVDWGMTPSEVLAATDGVAALDPGEPSDRRTFGDERVGNVGLFYWLESRFRAVFYFESNSLISFSLQPESMSDCLSILDKLETNLGSASNRDVLDRGNGLIRRVIDWSDDRAGNAVRFLNLSPSRCSIIFNKIGE
jgi:hypothetical protein